jgi:hypothetical protein
VGADVHAVNDALNAGSRSQDLVTAPGFIFLEPPTPTGIENANRVIGEHMAALARNHSRPQPGPSP